MGPSIYSHKVQPKEAEEGAEHNEDRLAVNRYEYNYKAI
jgi:hypothetical protein